jgi:hypothetical protein
MHRRTYLAALATTATAGCLGDRSAASADTGQPSDAGVRSTEAPPSSTVLTFQEWHRSSPLDVTVTDASTTSRLGTDDSTPADVLPEGTKLVVVSGLLENATDGTVALADAGVSFGVVASDRLFEAVRPSSSPELSAAIERGADASGTYLPAADGSLDPGEQRSVWDAVLVPIDVSTAEAQVALCGGADCGVRWTPSGKSCDCPG